MTPEEFKVKVDEVRTLIVEKLAELEEDPKWVARKNERNSRTRSRSFRTTRW